MRVLCGLDGTRGQAGLQTCKSVLLRGRNLCLRIVLPFFARRPEPPRCASKSVFYRPKELKV